MFTSQESQTESVWQFLCALCKKGRVKFLANGVCYRNDLWPISKDYQMNPC
jgi:hypothetical protein